MKISVLTPIYNRANLIQNLYNSLVENFKYNIDIEWLIMDDGSTDNIKEVVDSFIVESKINIKFYTQVNQGKMMAINSLVKYATRRFHYRL